MGLKRNREERIKPGHKEQKALVSRDSIIFFLENLGWIVPKLLYLSVSVLFLVTARNSKSTSPSSHVISRSHSIHENRNALHISWAFWQWGKMIFSYNFMSNILHSFLKFMQTSCFYSFWFFRFLTTFANQWSLEAVQLWSGHQWVASWDPSYSWDRSLKSLHN